MSTKSQVLDFPSKTLGLMSTFSAEAAALQQWLLRRRLFLAVLQAILEVSLPIVGFAWNLDL